MILEYKLENLLVSLSLDNSFENKEEEVHKAVKSILDFLIIPANNNDANCQKVDNYICFNIEDEKLSGLHEDLKDVISDMGHILHDTHSHPEIAEKFQGTPQQLLERLMSPQK